MNTPVAREGRDIHRDVVEAYPDYLRDESRRMGCADGIAFPETEEDVRDLLRGAARAGEPVTTQGARTGITGGAVPDGGLVLNLSRMNRMLGLRSHPRGGAVLTVQPGVTLADINRAAARREFDASGWCAEALAALREARSGGPLFFAPDLTEITASAGGLVACNGSGARSFSQGPARAHVEGLRAVFAGGGAAELRRGRERARGRAFRIATDAGGLDGTLPSYSIPAVKNAAGYYAADDMDLVDLLAGSEGTLAVLTAVELRLLPAPRYMWGVTAFLPGEEAAVGFAADARAAGGAGAIEFVDVGSLDLLREDHARGESPSGLPPLGAEWNCAVYVEYAGDDEKVVEARVTRLGELLAARGGNPDETWLATSPAEIASFKAFRHAVPESVNRRIDILRRTEPRLTKLGTDLSVPDERLADMMRLYREGLAREGLVSAIFGHIGNNHVHVNILPRDYGEYERGRALCAGWARAAVAMSGSVSAEHGIGKLKTGLLREMYGAAGIAEMRAVKRALDPAGLLNPGNLFPAEAVVT
jgi:D-lactate dehydrogenase (cytochrome)